MLLGVIVSWEWNTERSMRDSRIAEVIVGGSKWGRHWCAPKMDFFFQIHAVFTHISTGSEGFFNGVLDSVGLHRPDFSPWSPKLAKTPLKKQC